MSLTGQVLESAVTRCPIEVWQEVLKWAVIICVRTDDPSSHIAPLLPRYALMNHSSAWQTIYDEIQHKQTVLRHTGVDPCDWSLRLVCRAWNDLLLPLLFHTIRVEKHLSDMNTCVQNLSMNPGSLQYGEYVRCLVLEMGHEMGLEREDELQETMDALARACPRVETVHYELHVLFPQPTSGLQPMRKVRRLSLPNALLDMRALLCFATSLPELEVLDVARYEGWVEPTFSPPPDHQQRFPNLTHLCVMVKPGGTRWLSLLAEYDMPCLRHLYIPVASAFSLANAHSFLQACGAQLNSLVIFNARKPMSDDEQLAALSFCPNLEEFVTDLPDRCSTQPFPALPRLRTFAARGFALSRRRNSIGSLNRTANYTDSANSVRAFLSKLTVKTTPSLEVVRALDMPVGSEARKVLAEVGAATCGERGVKFEDVEGNPITHTGVHFGNLLSLEMYLPRQGL